jgi:hypothetical protein
MRYIAKKSAAASSSKGADVLVQVKANQPGLVAECENLARHCTPTQCDVQHDKGHGRVETRTVHIFYLPPHWLPEGWQPLVQQVARVSRTVEQRKAGRWHMTNETAWWVATAVLEAPVFQCVLNTGLPVMQLAFVLVDLPRLLLNLPVSLLHLGNQLRCEGAQLFRAKGVEVGGQVHADQSARTPGTVEAQPFTSLLASNDADHTVRADALPRQDPPPDQRAAPA